MSTEKGDILISDIIKRVWARDRQKISLYPVEVRDQCCDALLVSFAAKGMAEKLEISRGKGRYGWWHESCSTEYLRELLNHHIKKGDMRDVMNLAAMIYFRESAGIDGGQK